MTSFSDAGLWQPLDLASSPSGVRAGGTAFVPTLVPDAEEADETQDAASWLPSLRSVHQLSADQTRRVLEEEAFARGRAEASRVERERA